MVYKVLPHPLEHLPGPDAEVQAVVADGGDEVPLLDVAAPQLQVLFHGPHYLVVKVLEAVQAVDDGKGLPLAQGVDVHLKPLGEDAEDLLDAVLCGAAGHLAEVV